MYCTSTLKSAPSPCAHDVCQCGDMAGLHGRIEVTPPPAASTLRAIPPCAVLYCRLRHAVVCGSLMRAPLLGHRLCNACIRAAAFFPPLSGPGDMRCTRFARPSTMFVGWSGGRFLSQRQVRLCLAMSKLPRLDDLIRLSNGRTYPADRVFNGDSLDRGVHKIPDEFGASSALRPCLHPPTSTRDSRGACMEGARSADPIRCRSIHDNRLANGIYRHPRPEAGRTTGRRDPEHGMRGHRAGASTCDQYAHVRLLNMDARIVPGRRSRPAPGDNFVHMRLRRMGGYPATSPAGTVATVRRPRRLSALGPIENAPVETRGKHAPRREARGEKSFQISSAG